MPDEYTSGPEGSDGREVANRPTRLPATVRDWMAHRTRGPGLTLNDHVEALHLRIVEDPQRGPEYLRLLEAVYDEDAVEGSTPADDWAAANFLRQAARDGAHPAPAVASRKLASIVKAMRVVLRRYHMGRKERALTIGGEMVPPANNDLG